MAFTPKDGEFREELGANLPDDVQRHILVEFRDNDCSTSFSGHWDGKMVKAAIRSIERQYQATKHMVTRLAASERMRLANHVPTNGSDEHGTE